MNSPAQPIDPTASAVVGVVPLSSQGYTVAKPAPRPEPARPGSRPEVPRHEPAPSAPVPRWQECLLDMLDALPGPAMVWNRLGRLHYLNARGRSMLGISPSDDLSSHRISDFFSTRGNEQYLDEALPACLQRGSWRGETTIVDRDGREITVLQLIMAHPGEANAQIVFEPDADLGEPLFSSIAWDVGSYKEAERALRHRATHDSLTGLPNRALLMDRLQKAIHAARRHDYVVAVLFLDIDNFKGINDELGHETANDLLRRLGVRLHACVRAADTVARYGGDEFVLMMPDLPKLEDCRRVLEKIGKALEAPFLLSNQWVRVKASIGTASYPADGDEAAMLLKKADCSMYRTKNVTRIG